MYTMIIEQTNEYAKRMKYNPVDKSFVETEHDSLFHIRKCPYPYGWIKESGTPPQNHLDVILISNDSYSLGTEVEIKCIGVFLRADGDHKLISVPKNNHRVEDLSDLTDEEMTYLQNLYPSVSAHEGWHGKEQANRIIKRFK